MIGEVIDTNILLYAANKDCREHIKAREFLTEECDKSQFF